MRPGSQTLIFDRFVNVTDQPDDQLAQIHAALQTLLQQNQVLVMRLARIEALLEVGPVRAEGLPPGVAPGGQLGFPPPPGQFGGPMGPGGPGGQFGGGSLEQPEAAVAMILEGLANADPDTARIALSQFLEIEMPFHTEEERAEMLEHFLEALAHNNAAG